MPSIGSLLTVGEAAELLGVSASTIRNWDRSGKLKAIRHPVNNYRLYDRYELETLLDRVMPSNSLETKSND
jgi:excisionase family DNA binding protein